MRLPPRPDLTWKEDGTPVDERVGDIYFSVEDGLSESRAVFLAGCGLPDAWQERAAYTIAELGFGTGLNFLATWHMWRKHRSQNAWLNYVSFEGYPLDREDAERALTPWPEMQDLAQKLCEQWPARAKGVRQIIWPEDRICLTLHIGMIEETLPQARFAADAWFLDGFSPAKNQAMWGEALWPLIAERSAPGARAATFTVAGAVRRGLARNGFEVAKRPGHGKKRERLEATYKSSPKTSSSDPAEPLRVGVLGAGIAGACLAYFLRQRGAHVSVFDPANGPCEGTSGNPLALVMPRLDAGDTVQARLLIDAYLSAQSFYRGRPGVSPAETVHHPRNSQEAERFEKLLSDPPLGLRQLETIQGGGLLHKGSLAIRPADLLPSLLAGATMKWGEPPTVDLTARTINDERFDAILIANGWHMAELFPELDITGRLGQIEWLDSGVEAPASAMARGDYAIASGRTRLWGATFAGHNGGPALTSDAARAKNQAALEALAPYWVGEARTAKVSSRAGIRATTADRLPLIGPAPDLAALQADRKQLERAQWSAADNAYLQPGIYLAGGFGSRGFTWAPWAASILTARLFDDPAPTRLEALQAIVPNRQILRQMKRNSL